MINFVVCEQISRVVDIYQPVSKKTSRPVLVLDINSPRHMDGCVGICNTYFQSLKF